MKSSSISIIVPAFNEEKAVGSVVEALRSRIQDSEIIVVDDGSTDLTAVKAAASGALVVSHERNRGYGTSLKTGVRTSTRDYVLFCDGDGQHSAEDVDRIIQAADGYDMVVGSRTRQSHTPFFRRPGKAILKWFTNYLAGEKIPDINSGLRIVKKDVLMRYIHLMPQGFSFSATTTFALLKTNRRIRWVPIKAEKRQGSSTVQQMKHGPESLLLVLRLAVLFEPLKVFLSVAGGLFVLSSVSFIVDLTLNKGQGIADTTVLLSVATLIVFMFGLLCDQVSALRREKHD